MEEPGLAGAGLPIGDDLFTGFHNAIISKIEISDGTVPKSHRMKAGLHLAAGVEGVAGGALMEKVWMPVLAK